MTTQLKFTSHFFQLPESLQKLIQNAVETLQPHAIILFGSRARGDFREDSDFDIALHLPPTSKNKWSEFIVQVTEAPLTLHSVDLVDCEMLNDKYRQNIEKEGVLLYGNTTSK